MVKWQTINTYKSGEIVLLSNGHYIAIGQRDYRLAQDISKEWPWSFSCLIFTPPVALNDEVDAEQTLPAGDPTHWAPLPAPPKNKATNFGFSTENRRETEQEPAVYQ